MKTAEQFLDILIGKDLVEEKIIVQLQTQAKQATAKGKSLPAEKVADLLIEKEYLTKRQAAGIIDSIVEAVAQDDDELSLVIDDEPAKSAPAPKPAPKPAAKPAPKSTKSLEEELGLAPDTDNSLDALLGTSKPQPKPQPKPQLKPAPQPQAKPQPKPQPKPAAQPQAKPQPKPAAKPAPAPKKSEASLLEEELGLSGGKDSLLDDLMGSGATSNADPLASIDTDPLSAGGGTLQAAPKKKKGLAKLFDKVQKSVGVKPKTEAQVKAETKKKQKAAAENPWDSKLMLIGGGALLLLCIAGVALYFGLATQSGDDAFENAEKAYMQGSYTQSIELFEKFITGFPKHEKAGTAKVHRGLAKMRNAVEGSSNWSRSLSDVDKALSEITSVNEFPLEAPSELSSLLPKIAENLATEAFNNADATKLEDAKRALTLLDKHVPESKRPKTLTANLNALIAQAEGKLQCEGELKACLAAMDKKITENDSVGAYTLRDECLKKYPILRTDKRIKDETLKVSEIESKAVTFVEQSAEPTPVAELKQTPRVVLAQSISESEVVGVAQQTLLVPGRDLFGVSAKDGSVQWTCPQGGKVNFTTVAFPPTYLSTAIGADFVQLGENNTIERRSSKDGSIKWSFSLTSVGGEGTAFPLLTDKCIFVSQQNGRIYVIDLETGKQSGYYQLPQKLSAGACYDASNGTLYQPGEHTNLFVISTTEKKCLRTIYLGHTRGDIIASPAVAGEFVAVPVSIDADNGELRFFATAPGEDGTFSAEPAQTIKVQGRINATPQVLERKILACTHVGQMNVFERQAATPPFKLIAQYSPDTKPSESQTSFCSLTKEKVYKADTMLTMFDILSSTGRLRSNWTKNAPCDSTVAPTVIGKTIFHVRDSQPVLVSSHLDKDGTLCWQTLLNDKVIGTIASVDGGIEVITNHGAIFKCTFEQLQKGGINTQPVCAVQAGDILGGAKQAIRLAEGVYVCVGQANSNELLVLNPEEVKKLENPAEGKLRFARSAIFKDKISGEMKVMNKWLVIPFEKGQILLVDPVSGETKADPFVAEMASDAKRNWILSETFDTKKFIASSGTDVLNMELEKSSSAMGKALVKKTQSTIDSPVCSAIVICDKNALFVTQTGGLQVLDKDSLQTAKADNAVSIDSTQLTGLWSNGKVVLATMKNGMVIAMDSTGKELWSKDGFGIVLTSPGFDGSTALLCSADSKATLVNLDSGDVAGTGVTPGPESVAPVKLNDKWYGASESGEVFEIKVETK